MTTTLKKPAQVKRVWYQIDARSRTLGRMASLVAWYLMGKHHLDFTPHVDMGDYVVVVHADAIKVTGRKSAQKKYTRYSGYPGGITAIPMKDLLVKRPEYIIREAVRRMLPKNKLQRRQLRRLHIVRGGDHKFKIHQIIS